MTGMGTLVDDILTEPEVERPLCHRCGLPLIPVNYGKLVLYVHGDPDECERTCEVERHAARQQR
jgi:hypothetical protein